MPKHLVIVESPAKAKTIKQYLGSDFEVKSSIGHIRGLPSKDGSVDVSNNFAPKFEIDPEKKKTISELKKSVKSASTVWLASDEDREGEAIAWHLSEVLDLDPKKTKRIVFHEITKSALSRAIENPRGINMELVEAQQARQSLDYLVGFELSPVLWRKVRPKLSAGRVQSVATRLIVEREKEIEAHEPEASFKVTAVFSLDDGTQLPAKIDKKYTNLSDVRTLLKEYAKSTFKVAGVEKKPGKRNPSAPFTTSTLQQEASSKLGFSPRLTMQLAQRLYESGYITYMRTDSVNLSSQAIGSMATYIKEKFGAKYHQPRTYASKSINAQEAHEAIRPTNAKKQAAGADAQQEKLYNLIWRRAVASQMAPAELEKTTVTINPSHSDQEAEAAGEVVIFDGFFKVYGRASDDVLLPPLQNGDMLSLKTAEATETLSRGPARYTEASLVKRLEEMGIGRPSTYASTINTIQARGYVERTDVPGEPRSIRKLTLDKTSINESIEQIQYGKDSNKLVPTDTGKVVNDFLVKHFSEVMDYDFTKTVEKELDEIALGKKDRIAVLKAFYDPFHKLVKASAEVSRAEVTQARLLGKDPKTGKPVYARFGKYGPMLQRGEQSETEKPDFTSLPEGTRLETVTLEQALEMFKLPRIVGKTEDGQEIKANTGRFGPYIQVGATFVSIKPLDPKKITEKEARKLYQEKLKNEAKKHIKEFENGLKILKGPYGAYITDGKKNARIPKEADPRKITETEAKDLLEKAPAKKSFRRASKR
jgi:DNA topoisomerase-1